MHIKLDLHTADELAAAATFCTALAEARRKEDEERKAAPEFAFGIDRAMNSIWRRVEEPSSRTVVKEDVTAGEIVDALHGALKAETTAEDADGVEFPVKEVGVTITNTPRPGELASVARYPRRGRPRKEAPVAEEPVVLEGEVLSAEPEQIDIEDAIAVDKALHGSATEGAGPLLKLIQEMETAPQPEDPAVGWTTQDARNAGRALLDRAPDVDTGNRKLAATLVPFGVQQVKALQPDQIEAFVIATQKAVF